MRRDGTEFPVELTITRIALPGPPTFTGYLRDITDRVTGGPGAARVARAPGRGRRRRAQAHPAQPPRRRAAAAHLGPAAPRLAQRNVDEQTRRGLETILSESERAARIVRNLLTFARKRHTTRAMVDLNQVVRETLALRSYEQRISNITVLEALAAGPAAGVCRSAPDPAGAAQPRHQRRAGDARRARPRHAHHPHLARPRS